MQNIAGLTTKYYEFFYLIVKKNLQKNKIRLKFIRRGLFIFCLGLIITFATWIYLSRGFIIFGILHCIGISIILAYPFIRYKIPTDCADAVYAIRWIYARIAHLPAAATTKDGRRIGHWSTDWKHLPTHPEWHMDERFRAALLYLFPRTWTGRSRPFSTAAAASGGT
jgi:hypothetical protein